MKTYIIFIVGILLYHSIQHACQDRNTLKVNQIKSCFVTPDRCSPLFISAIGLRESIATALIMENQDNTTNFIMAHYDHAHKCEHIAQLEAIVQKEKDALHGQQRKKATVIIAYPIRLYQNWFRSWFSDKKEHIPLYPTWQQEIINIIKELNMPTEILDVSYIAGGDRGALFTVENNPSPILAHPIKYYIHMDQTAYTNQGFK